jgi:chromosomal replication initiator protein DnaA
VDKLSTFYKHMLSELWNQLTTSFFEPKSNKEKPPIIYSILKQTKLIELTESRAIVECENPGVKIFLDKKISDIESRFFLIVKKKIKIEFVVAEKKIKKNPPLFTYQPKTEDLLIKSSLSVKYSFDNFAVSSTNQVAYAAAQAVVKNPGKSYNPLFIYGGVGVGKTHLAQAIGRKILENDLKKKVFFCPGDLFINELIESIQEKTTQKFRKKYRHLDVLIVDDIQFIAGKERVQEDFFHTFNSIVSAGGQIILTSDRPPNEIKKLEDRLRSRFLGGLTVDIQPPDFELRTAILLIKAREKGILIDIEAAKVIADQITDCRALEGTLLTIYANFFVKEKKEKIDLSMVDEYFSNQQKNNQKKISPDDVLKTVCSYYNLKPSQIKSSTRVSNFVFPRQLIMYILREHLKMKQEEIARFLKRKDHTTIIHGVEKIRQMILKNPLIKEETDGLIKNIFQST